MFSFKSDGGEEEIGHPLTLSDNRGGWGCYFQGLYVNQLSGYQWASTKSQTDGFIPIHILDGSYCAKLLSVTSPIPADTTCITKWSPRYCCNHKSGALTGSPVSCISKPKTIIMCGNNKVYIVLINALESFGIFRNFPYEFP